MIAFNRSVRLVMFKVFLVVAVALGAGAFGVVAGEWRLLAVAIGLPGIAMALGMLGAAASPAAHRVLVTPEVLRVEWRRNYREYEWAEIHALGFQRNFPLGYRLLVSVAGSVDIIDGTSDNAGAMEVCLREACRRLEIRWSGDPGE